MTSNIDTSIPPFGNATTSGVRSNFASAKAEIETLQTLVTDVTSSVATANTEIETLQTLVSDVTSSVATANTEIDALQILVSDVTSSVETANTEIDALQTLVSDVTSSVATANTEIDELQTLVSDVTSSVEAANTEIDVLQTLVNDSGQVKVNYDVTLQIIGVTSGAPKTFDIGAATPIMSGFPTTTYPASSPSQTFSAMFDISRGTLPNGRLIENPVPGQIHFWRVQGNFNNKTTSQTGSLKIRLRNLSTGFLYDQSIILSDGLTGDYFNIILISIADSASIPAPYGYILDLISNFTDADLIINIFSITRISIATEPHLPL